MVTLDESFEALRDPQRRRLLLALLESNPRDDTPVVSERAVEGLDDERGLVQYRHVHLPKLEAYGLVDWNQAGGQVTKGPAFEEVRPLLELLRDDRERFPADAGAVPR